jgi:hypothetical protein
MENPDYLGVLAENPGQNPNPPSILFNPTPIIIRRILNPPIPL